MRFLRVTNNKDMAILTDFINNLTEEIESFTYFNKRPFNIVLNHEFTYLLLADNDEPVGYGHIEKEENNFWLGIVISKKYQRKGFGISIMNKLIEDCVTSKIPRILLSVRKKNIKAFNLYDKMGFSVVREDELNLFLEKSL